jgi:hypothetical protein
MDKPSGNSITMRLAEKTDHAIWSWVKQSDGKVGLAIQVLNSDIHVPEIPISKHFEVKEKVYENYPPMLTLICVNYEFFEIFEVLCQDLINYSKSLRTVEQLLLGIKNRILVWYELFKKDFKGLTKKQVIGLAAELTFLKLWITKFKENIGTWIGPEDSPQDFIPKNRSFAVETKAASWALADIKISSLFQMDFSGRLYVAVFPSRLVDSDDPAATNLDEIIDSIRKDLDPANTLSFETKLLLAGYVPNKFNDIHFELGLPIFYRVVDGFPKLTKANIASSIVDCKYTISLVDLEVFKVTLDEIEVET